MESYKVILSSFFFVVLFSYVQSQYTITTYYPGAFNCSGTPHRVEYKPNASCTEEGCINVGISSRYLSCDLKIPVTSDTVTIMSYSTPDCSGDATSVGVCVVGTSGYSKINCEGSFSCTDVQCSNCTFTSLPTTCKGSKTSTGSNFYICNPLSPTPSPSSSSSSSLSSSSLYSSPFVLISLFVGVFVFGCLTFLGL